MIDLQTAEDQPTFFPLRTAAQLLDRHGLGCGGPRPLYRAAKRGELRVVKINDRDLRTCSDWLRQYVETLAQQLRPKARFCKPRQRNGQIETAL